MLNKTLPQKNNCGIVFVLFNLFLLLASGANAIPIKSSEYSRKEIMNHVTKAAIKLRLDPSLALAVAHAESNFNPSALSRKGARGVMQIMPATSEKEYNTPPNKLWDPLYNIYIGLHYLQRLLSRYRGRKDLALSFYNGGSKVDRNGRHHPSVIPYTVGYVMKVTHLRFYYRKQIRNGKLKNFKKKQLLFNIK